MVKKNEKDKDEGKDEGKNVDEGENKLKTKIDPTKTWMNKTSSGKGFVIHVMDEFELEDVLLGSITALEEFIAGERNGINLGILLPVEEE